MNGEFTPVAPAPTTAPSKIPGKDVGIGFGAFLALLVITFYSVFGFGGLYQYSFLSKILQFLPLVGAVALMVWALVKRRFGILLGMGLALAAAILIFAACDFLVFQSFN